jgi:predicted O-methyltransferase YrrM
MHFDEVRAAVGNTPHMSAAQGRVVYDHIAAARSRRILELGFAHGTSTCYMAAALDEIGGEGHIVTIDNRNALSRDPSIFDMLDRCGLAHRVTPVIADTSYTWELMGMLERDPQPRFDFVFVDGAHLWDVDGFAFLLADRLLVPGGWVLFDDLDWTLGTSPSLRNKEWVQALPEEQRKMAQVRKVFELLVRAHPEYTDLRDEDGWGWARKRPGRPWALRRRRGSSSARERYTSTRSLDRSRIHGGVD